MEPPRAFYGQAWLLRVGITSDSTVSRQGTGIKGQSSLWLFGAMKGYILASCQKSAKVKESLTPTVILERAPTFQPRQLHPSWVLAAPASAWAVCSRALDHLTLISPLHTPSTFCGSHPKPSNGGRSWRLCNFQCKLPGVPHLILIWFTCGLPRQQVQERRGLQGRGIRRHGKE